jgi:hypothetical protein
MTEDRPMDFACPQCNAQYKVVRVKAEPGKWYRPVLCSVCETTMASIERDKVLKYFLEQLPPAADPDTPVAPPRLAATATSARTAGAGVAGARQGYATTTRASSCAGMKTETVPSRATGRATSLAPDWRRGAMGKIAVDWGAYDLKERDFEQALAEGTARLIDHPLPSGGVLSTATDEQVALAARQFEQRGQDLLALAGWLLAKRLTPHVAAPAKLSRLLAMLETLGHGEDAPADTDAAVEKV